MAQILKIKRGNNANLPSLTLEAGEPAFVLDTGKLYVGNDTNKVLINPDIPSNSQTTDKLKTAKRIELSGDVTGSVLFDGSSDVTITTTEKASGVTPGTYCKVIVDTKGNVTAGEKLISSDIPSLALAKISDAGTAASKNVGTSSGNIPILDSNGKLDTNILPALAITDTFLVDNETEMLALTAQKGDVAVRKDLNKSFILKLEPPTVLTNWQELLTPTDTVLSVAGKTGIVALTSSDVGLGNVTNESKSTMFTNPIFTGIPVAPTPSAETNTTQIATTAFVNSVVANKTSISGNAGTATKLATPRTIAIAGDVVGSCSFDGSYDTSITATISNIDGGTF
ncbi:hypothetical protein UT300005_31810 [Clostridium sp. CTA-5]